MIAMIIILSIIALIAVLMFIPVRATVYVKYENSKSANDYKIKYGFITIMKKKQKDKADTQSEKSKKKKKKDKPKPKPKVSDIIRFLKTNIKDIKRLFKDVLRYSTKRLVRIDKLSIISRLGTDDAMNTALSYGGASAVLFNGIGVLEKQIRIKRTQIDFQPDFTEEKIFLEFECIIRTKIYNIIGLAVLALRRALPILKKRGEINNGKSN